MSAAAERATSCASTTREERHAPTANISAASARLARPGRFAEVWRTSRAPSAARSVGKGANVRSPPATSATPQATTASTPPHASRRCARTARSCKSAVRLRRSGGAMSNPLTRTAVRRISVSRKARRQPSRSTTSSGGGATQPELEQSMITSAFRYGSAGKDAGTPCART